MISLAIFAIVIFSTIGYYSLQAYQEKNNLLTDTLEYLEENGYDRTTDVEEITIVQSNEAMGEHAAMVRLKEEPHTKYFYAYKKDSKEIYQVNKITDD